MIFHVNTCGTARSQREITGLPAFAAAPRPSRGLAPRSVRIKDLSPERAVVPAPATGGGQAGPAEEAVACRCRHSCRPGSDNGADHHVARIVHADMDARVGDAGGEQPDRLEPRYRRALSADDAQ